MFLIDYGDNSLVDFPRPVNSQTQLVHKYPHAGIFKVNVTVFNSVSSVSNSIQVIYPVNKNIRINIIFCLGGNCFKFCRIKL